MTAMIARVRRQLGDYGESFQQAYISDGSQTRFSLPVENVNPTTLVVQDIYSSSVTLVPPLYVLEPQAGNIVLRAPLVVGHTLLVTGTYDEYFGDDALTDYITEAVGLHTAGRFPPIYFDTPPSPQTSPPSVPLPPVENLLVAIMAAMNALWDEFIDAAQDIDVHLPEISIPAQERYEQLQQAIGALDARYQKLSLELGVGLYAVKMLTLRRVSRTTGRLVPIYVAQEYDDITYPPVRVYPQIDQGLPS